MIPTLIFLPAAFRSDWPFFAARIVYLTLSPVTLHLTFSFGFLAFFGVPEAFTE